MATSKIDASNAKNIKLSEKVQNAFFMLAQAKDLQEKAKAEISKYEKPLKEFLNEKEKQNKLTLSQVYRCGDIVFRYADNGENVQTDNKELEEFLNKHDKSIKDFKHSKGKKAPTLEINILITT